MEANGFALKSTFSFHFHPLLSRDNPIPAEWGPLWLNTVRSSLFLLLPLFLLVLEDVIGSTPSTLNDLNHSLIFVHRIHLVLTHSALEYELSRYLTSSSTIWSRLLLYLIPFKSCHLWVAFPGGQQFSCGTLLSLPCEHLSFQSELDVATFHIALTAAGAHIFLLLSSSAGRSLVCPYHSPETFISLLALTAPRAISQKFCMFTSGCFSTCGHLSSRNDSCFGPCYVKIYNRAQLFCIIYTLYGQENI